MSRNLPNRCRMKFHAGMSGDCLVYLETSLQRRHHNTWVVLHLKWEAVVTRLVNAVYSRTGF